MTTLIHQATKAPVQIGDALTDFRGDSAVVASNRGVPSSHCPYGVLPLCIRMHMDREDRPWVSLHIRTSR